MKRIAYILLLIPCLMLAQSRINVRSVFGFSGTNNTTIIQNAINAHKGTGDTLYFDTNSGANPIWYMTATFRINNVENLVFLFQEGVTIEGTNGSAFYGGDNCADERMWNMAGWRNVTMIGYGAKFRMYQQASQTNCENGHMIDINPYFGAQTPQNIKILGLELHGSGGDGIYVLDCGGSFGTLIEDVYAHGHSRQGISIISATGDVIVKRSRFDGTNKKAPKYGLDVEPNTTQNVAGALAGDIIFEDCSFVGNDGSGIGLEMFAVSNNASPFTFKAERCYLANNNLAHPYSGKIAEITTSRTLNSAPLQGSVLYKDIAIDGSTFGAISAFTQGQAGAFVTTYKDLVGYNVSSLGSYGGIRLIADGVTTVLGNQVFDGVYIKMAGNDFVLGYKQTGGKTIRNVTGDITAVSTFGKWTETDGGTTDNVTVSISQNTSLPTTTVNVSATTPEAVKGGQNGVFNFTRSSTRIDYPIFVKYSISAPDVKLRNEVGYLTGAVVIPKGATSATVSVVARTNGISQDARPLTVTITERTGMYTVGSNNSDTVYVVDSGGSPPPDPDPDTHRRNLLKFIYDY